MLVDLHVHTRAYSACSTITSEDLLRAMEQLDLSGVCITEHEIFHVEEDWRRVKERAKGFLLFQGIEMYFPECEVLLYGVERSILKQEEGNLERLLRRVDESGGASVLAHPFRHTTHIDDLSCLLESLPFHGVEVENGNCGLDCNQMAEKLRKRFGLASVGGSDAHMPGRIGIASTFFEIDVLDEVDLARAIREGLCEARRSCG